MYVQEDGGYSAVDNGHDQCRISQCNGERAYWAGSFLIMFQEPNINLQTDGALLMQFALPTMTYSEIVAALAVGRSRLVCRFGLQIKVMDAPNAAGMSSLPPRSCSRG